MKRLFSVVLAVVFLLGGSVRADLFKDGETVCFLGGSITHGCQYHSMVH